ncbi:lipoxygenase [Xylariales sp. PMI_506]|nr:lipoxygenase [Xylariales sp. PMI_506]
MRLNTCELVTNGPRLSMMAWSFLLYILYIQALLVSASPLATVKRDTGVDMVMDIFRGVLAQAPVVTEAGSTLLNQLLKASPQSYTITPSSTDPLRSANLDIVRTSFQYGAPIAGGPYYPSGLLGAAKSGLDIVDFLSEFTPELALMGLDITKATLDVEKASTYSYNGLQTLDDYVELYKGEWQNTIPDGVDQGMLTNYTQDLLFSMQRLSSSPYQIRRLNSAADTLPFTIDNNTTTQITGLNLQQLFQQGRLFYADYRDQANLTASPGHYAATCDAYFYIHPASGNFLPLAIRSNLGPDLIYTPLDDPNDWLLAKVMFNVNDFWFAQWNHFAATHEVLQIVWAAAIRSISQEHPIYAILYRLTYQLYAYPIVAEALLFAPGGVVDGTFPYTGLSAQSYTTNRYFYSGVGRFQDNYFASDLKSRGLLGSESGPALKSFPFFEDASVIFNATHTFMTIFVNSYYSSDVMVAADQEIQHWVTECNGPAQVMDFPSQITTIATLVDVLTHVAHLSSTSHHTINTNELLQTSSVLPFCPVSLYAPPPTSKANSTLNVADFLPKFPDVLQPFNLGGSFARPLIAGSSRSIIHMFDDQAMLGRMNAETQAANTAFIYAMGNFSTQVSSRTFGPDGLSQGMPFVWKALDPNVAPYSVTT